MKLSGGKNKMPYDEIKREMTLQGEIENLEVPQNVKERLLQKLKEMYSEMNKKYVK